MTNKIEGQVISIGGGGFGLKPLIEEYIINQCNKNKPNVCFIPTASAEDKAYTVRFYSTFNSLSILYTRSAKVCGS